MRSIKLNIYLTLIIAVLFSSVSYGQKASVGAMLLFGTGKMGNTTGVLSRSMIYTPVALFAGYNIKKFRVGINYEYNLVGQSEDPASLGNQNLGGKGANMGLRLEFYDGKQAAGMVYHLSERYTLDKPTLLGAASVYEGKSGFSFQYYRQFKNRFGFVIDFSSGDMKSVGANTDDIKWDRIGLGIVFTNFGGK